MKLECWLTSRAACDGQLHGLLQHDRYTFSAKCSLSFGEAGRSTLHRLQVCMSKIYDLEAPELLICGVLFIGWLLLIACAILTVVRIATAGVSRLLLSSNLHWLRVSHRTVCRSLTVTMRGWLLH